MKVCLDTNALSALMVEGQGDRTLLAKEVMEEAERVFVPTIVLGEALFGFAKGNREAENRRRLRDFLEQPGMALAPVDADAAERYARIFLHLRGIGKPIPQNDVWIAGIAASLGAALLTFDAHFRHVPGLLIVPET